MDAGGSSVRSARNRPRDCVARGELLELLEVVQPRGGAARSVAANRARRSARIALELRARPAGPCLVGAARRAAPRSRRSPSPSAAVGHREADRRASDATARTASLRPPMPSRSRAARCRRPDARRAAAARGTSAPRRAGSPAPQHRQRVLHVRGLQELQPAVLHERDVAPRQLHLEQVAVVAGAEQDGLLAAAACPARGARGRARQTSSACSASSEAGDQDRPRAAGARSARASSGDRSARQGDHARSTTRGSAASSGSSARA